MRKTITVELLNDNALKLLEDLELLHIIRLTKDEVPKERVNWKEEYSGKMTSMSVEEIDAQLKELRDAW